MSLEGGETSGGARWAVAGAFLGLFVLQGLLLVVPVKRDARPLSWDHAVHMRAAWFYRRALEGGRWADLFHPPHSPGHPPYPPLAHVAMGEATYLSGPLGFSVETSAVVANLFFLMVLAWAAYLLGSDAWGEVEGVSAAFLASLMPPMLTAGRTLVVDVALAAWVALTYAAWMRSRGFFVWRWTLLAGVAAAAGMMTKWTFFLYVFPILGESAFDFWRASERGVRQRIVLCVLIAALPFAAWFGVNFVNVVAKVSRAASLGAQEGDPTRGAEALFFYFGVLRDGLGWIGLGAAAAGFLWMGMSRPRNLAVFGGWFLSSYLVWTCVSNKDARYLLPALPALALAAAGLPFRLPVLLAAALAGTAAAGLPSFHPQPSWPLQSILVRAVEGRPSGRTAPSVLTLLANHERMNGNNLLWVAEREGYDRDLIVRSRSTALGAFSEFVVVKTGDLGPPNSVAGHEKLREEALRPDGWFQRSFVKEAAWPLPDGSEAQLFQRSPVASAPGFRMDPAGALSRLFPGTALEGFTASCADAVFKGTGDCAVRAVQVRADGLTVSGLAASLDGLRVAVDDEGRPRLLDLGRAEVRSLKVSAADAARLLAERVKALKGAFVLFLPGNRVEAGGRLKGFLPVRVGARLVYDAADDAVRAEDLSVRVLGLPLPVGKTAEISLRPGRGWPFLVKLSGLKTVPGTNGGEGFLEVAP